MASFVPGQGLVRPAVSQSSTSLSGPNRNSLQKTPKLKFSSSASAYWSPNTAGSASAMPTSSPPLRPATGGPNMSQTSKSFIPKSQGYVPPAPFTPSAKEFVPGGAKEFVPSDAKEFVPGDAKEFVPTGAKPNATFTANSGVFVPVTTKNPSSSSLRSSSEASEFIPGNSARINKPVKNVNSVPVFVPGNNVPVNKLPGNYVPGNYVDSQPVFEPNETPRDFFELPPSVPAIQPRVINSLYMPDHFRDYFAHQSMHLHAQVSAGDARLKMIPKGYDCILPLDIPRETGGSSINPLPYPSSIFKVVRWSDVCFHDYFLSNFCLHTKFCT